MDITKKYVPCLILSVLLVFSLIGFAAAFNFNFIALSEGTYISASEENDVPRKAHDEMETYFTHSEDYSGIPADVYMSALPVEAVKDIINSKINKVLLYLKMENAELDTASDHDYSDLRKNITDYFDTFAKKNNVKVDKEYTTQLNNTVEKATNEIESFADVYMFREISKTGLLKKTKDIYPDLTPATYAMGALSLLFILILMAICLKRVGLGCFWTGISSMCAAVIMLIPTLYIKLSGFTDRLIVDNESIYSAVTGAVSKIISTLVYFECGMFVFGILMLLIYALSSLKRRKKASEISDDDDDEAIDS